MRDFKLYLVLVIIVSLFVLGCSGSVKSDIYLKQDYSIEKDAKVAVGYFNVRTNTPYIRLNFKEQLEYHLLKRGYSLARSNKVAQYYKANKIDFNSNLTDEEIRVASKSILFSLFIQGIIYELDRSLYEDKNHIIVHLNIFNPEGQKLSTIRYIYHGDKSLVSGDLIDEVINTMLDELHDK